MTQKTKDKIKKTREDTRKKVFDVCGWEVWIDPLNYTAVKNGKNHYYSTLLKCCKGIVQELERDGIKRSKTLDEAIIVIQEADNKFIGELKGVIESVDKPGQE